MANAAATNAGKRGTKTDHHTPGQMRPHEILACTLKKNVTYVLVVVQSPVLFSPTMANHFKACCELDAKYLMQNTFLLSNK